MKGQGYVSVKSEDAASAEVDRGTARLALVVSALSCAISLAAIGYVVSSISHS